MADMTRPANNSRKSKVGRCSLGRVCGTRTPAVGCVVAGNTSVFMALLIEASAYWACLPDFDFMRYPSTSLFQHGTYSTAYGASLETAFEEHDEGSGRQWS